MIGNLRNSILSRTFLAVVIAAAAIAGLTGCSKAGVTPSDNVSPPTSASASPTASSTTDASPSDGSNTASTSPDAATDKVYYGEWTVSKVLAYGSVGTYSKADAEKQIGAKLSFSADKATIINDQPSDKTTDIKQPDYQEASATSEDFTATYKMSFDQLGITAASVTEVIVPGQDTGGCTLLIKDQNTMVLAVGGTYFELTRAK